MASGTHHYRYSGIYMWFKWFSLQLPRIHVILMLTCFSVVVTGFLLNSQLNNAISLMLGIQRSDLLGFERRL